MSLLELDRPEAEPEIPESDPAVVAFVRRPDTCLSAMIDTALGGYLDREALAWRPYRDGVLSDTYVSIDFKELRRRAYAVAATLVHDPALRMKPGQPIGIMAFANVDFVALNLALGLDRMVIAPLQTSASLEALTGLVKELEAPSLAGSVEHLDSVVTLAIACAQTRCVLLFDHDGLDAAAETALAAARARLAAEKPDCVILPFSEAIARGEAYPAIERFVPGADKDPLALIYYTSGSTGTPKGAMYSEKLVKAAYASAREKSPVVLHYQPLNHSFGMSYIAMALASGGTTYFTGRTDLSTLLDDMKLVRPTAMALVPRVCELLYQRFHADYADEIAKDPDAALKLFRERTMGGRLADVSTGSAPLTVEMQAFVQNISGGKAFDGYGATEVGLVSIDGFVQKPPVLDYKLIDVPELGYFTTDKPHPRGELIVLTKTLFLGYFARPDLTAQVIDADGYYHTGDIMAEVEPGRIQYLDRRNNVIKLSQGEFVPVAQLEALYAGSAPGVRQIYLHGNSARAYLLGVVVPDLEALPAGLGEKEIKAHILAAMEKVATENSRHKYEIPRDIIIESEPFSAENGLLAGVGKHMRPAFRARYEERLEALYESIASGQERELHDLRQNGRNAPLLETICRAAAAVLGGDRVEDDDQASFAGLGGDSLAALSYALLLEDIYGFPVDVGTIMHPAGSFAQLAGEIERALAGGGNDPFAATHGSETSLLRATDLTIDKLVDPAVLRDAGGLPPPAETEPKTVLLTGANGFLGRFLCLEWLKRLERTGGRLICIGRGADDESARKRLLDVFVGGDGAFEHDLTRLAADGRLTVIAGDLAAPHLGLPDAQWAKLADEVDLIVHPAALVNHKLPYRQLFGPNVVGTATLIELALTTRMKRIAHVSTVAAAAHGGAIADEDADLRKVIPEWQTSDSYADGYGASKWAAEMLLADAHERFGIPVSVFRSNMILAPIAYSGQLNVPDVFTRQILSLALTRIAPQSFYAGDGTRAHYEGLPVDFIAAAIVAAGEARRTGYHNFHVLNPHDDGISMDSFVGWLDDLGYRGARIASFDEWRSRFEGAMRALPEERRHASLLPLMDAFTEPQHGQAGSWMSATRFVEVVAETKVTGDGEIPHLGPALIGRYVEDLKATGLL